MGSSGHALRKSAASSAPRQQRSAARQHPYAVASKSQPQHALIGSSTSETRLSPAATAAIAALRPNTTQSLISAQSLVSAAASSELGASLATENEAGPLLADDWSPFSSPDVQQCMGSGSQAPSASLLGHMERTPMYSSECYPTYYAPAARPNNPRVATTYAGYKYPFEHITVRVLDIDSGEFLRQFPHR